MLIKRLFLVFLLVSFFLGFSATAIDKNAKRKELIDFVASRINDSKAEYPLLKDFNTSNIFQKDGGFSVAYNKSGVTFLVFFGSVFNPKVDNAKVTDSFFVDELGEYIHCSITGDQSTVERLKGILMSIPAIKNCTANSKNGDWDDCVYMI